MRIHQKRNANHPETKPIRRERTARIQSANYHALLTVIFAVFITMFSHCLTAAFWTKTAKKSCCLMTEFTLNSIQMMRQRNSHASEATSQKVITGAGGRKLQIPTTDNKKGLARIAVSKPSFPNLQTFMMCRSRASRFVYLSRHLLHLHTSSYAHRL